MKNKLIEILFVLTLFMANFAHAESAAGARACRVTVLINPSGYITRLPDGSASAPSLTFINDPDSGLYRAGSDDVRMSVGGVDAEKWTPSGVTIPAPAIPNSTALTTTGSGNGAGASFTGGPSNGVGAVTRGQGSGPGLSSQGGPTDGPGAVLTGQGIGNGANLQGGSDGGYGLLSSGGPGAAAAVLAGGTNAVALSAQGNGTAAAADLIPGASSKVAATAHGVIVFDATDSTGTPGNATINNPSGQSAFAAGASAVTISNTFVTTKSILVFSLQTNDATCTTTKSAIPGANTVTFNVPAVCTGITKFGWAVLNQ